VLKEREQQEHVAAKDVAPGVDVSRLDKGAAELRAMGRLPAALAADLAEIEKEHAELLAKAAGKRDQKDGRESMRRLLEDGRITLAPNPSHTALAGPVYSKELGEHVLELAGLQRCCMPSGSGGPLRAL